MQLIKEVSQLNRNPVLAALLLEQIKDQVKDIIGLEIDKVLQVACYTTIKRTYAQEVQYLFFMGTKTVEEKANI